MALGDLPVTAPARETPLRRESLLLTGGSASVPQARRFVRDVLGAWQRSEYEEAGTLLVSELVSNAVLHARTPAEVELVERRDGVLLGVSDAAPALPVLRRHGREAGTGRGLWLLAQYSASHGVDVTRPGSGKQVWAVLCPEVQDPAEGTDAALARWLDQLDGL